MNIDKSQLQWQCRRGMLELDVILKKYLNTKFDFLTELQQQQFAELLQHSDQDLFDWFLKKKIPENKVIANTIQSILDA